MVAAAMHIRPRGPFSLVVSGEASQYSEALEKIVGHTWLVTHQVLSDEQVLEIVQEGRADAAVLDTAATQLEPLRLLRMIRQMQRAMPVVLLTNRSDRRWLQEALRLAAFSVVSKPLRLEELLFQIHRMMIRLDATLRRADL